METITIVAEAAVISMLRRHTFDNMLWGSLILTNILLKLMEICFIPALLILLGALFDLPKLYYRISVSIYFVLWLVYIIFFKWK